MKFLAFWNNCKKCGFEFETLSDPGLYSFRLLLSERNHLPAIAKCDEDPAFGEVHQIVERLLKPKGYPALKIANIFDKIFGDICDYAPDGSLYNMTGEKKCPDCGSTDVDFGPYHPEVYKEEEPHEITHKRWDFLNPIEKGEEIKKRIAALFLES